MCKVASNLLILAKRNQLVIIKIIIEIISAKQVFWRNCFVYQAEKLEANCRLFKLEPYFDAKYALRVGGRIQKSLTQQGIQHSVLLPRDL